MRNKQHSAVFGKRSEPHTIIIARGDHIRHFTFRPWVGAAVGSLLALLAVGYLLATTYLVLRDDLIGASLARQARMQQAYEDRISALRGQVDRITSRQLLDQQFMQEKVGELFERQQKLTQRHGQLDPLLQRIGGKKSEDLPIPSPRPEVKAGLAPERDDMVTGAIEPLAFAASTSAKIPWPLRSPSQGELRTASAADRADALFVKLNRALRTIESEQIDSVKNLAENAYQTAGVIADALEAAGVTVDAEYDQADIGGPLLASASPELFESQVRELDEALEKLGKLKSKARALPLANPAPGATVSSRFGKRRDPFLGRPAHHSGVDFRADRGTAVRSSGAGIVVKAGWNGGYGRMVEIDHGDGLTSRYAHMSKILVKKGQQVSQGETVGRVGSSGRSTGPHLHYEIRRNGTATDPLRFIGVGRKIASYL